jgi:hypothetical protein
VLVRAKYGPKFACFVRITPSDVGITPSDVGKTPCFVGMRTHDYRHPFLGNPQIQNETQFPIIGTVQVSKPPKMETKREKGERVGFRDEE